MKALLRFLRRVASSRLGHTLVVAHLVILVSEFAHKPAATYSETPCVPEPSSAVLIAGRYFHWHYESALLKTVSVLDMPAILLGSLASKLLAPLRLCDFTASWVDGLLVLAFASFQWLLVGFLVSSIGRAFWKGGRRNRGA